MSRMSRMLKALQNEAKSGSENGNDFPSAESLDVSSIERASFLQGEEFSPHGNPLHSTALEDDRRPESDQRKPTAEKPKGKRTESDVQGMSETPKRPVHHSEKNLNTQQKRDVQAQKKRSKSLERRDSASTSKRLRTVSESRNKRARSKEPDSVGSAPDTSPDTADSQSQRKSSFSTEDLTDEDESFHTSTERRKRTRMSLPRPGSSSSQPKRGQKQKRKSSSGSSDNSNPTKRQKPGGVSGAPTNLSVVLEAFQEFVNQYKETVSSVVVQKAINALAHSFEEQLTEMITAVKEFSSVKREAIKVNRTLNQKRSRLLEVKNELIKSKAEVRKIEKEHNDLEQRLTAIKQGTTFLNNLKALNMRYLQHRNTRSDEVETYGPSCVPAMLLEARCITGTENHLKSINNTLQQVLDEIKKD